MNAHVKNLPGPLPEATTTPCAECPWRTDSAPGYLGPQSAEEWIATAHSDAPIACHKTVRDPLGMQTPGARQCRGAAAYRQNVAKSPRDPQDAANLTREPRGTGARALVFSSPNAFLEHHKRR